MKSSKFQKVLDTIVDRCTVKPGTKVDLRAIDPNETFGIKKEDALKQTKKNLKLIAEYQELMYAEQVHSLLMCLQGMDTSGKDGTVRVIGGAMNPAGVSVISYKKPNAQEMAEVKADPVNGFLARIERGLPHKPGLATLFNRSQYEDVGVVRVHNFVPESVWRPRFGLINEWEKHVTEPSPEIPGGTDIKKCFLHISPDKQLKNIGDRLSDPNKHWKLSEADFEERHLFGPYMDAYSEAISETSTEDAPWLIVPSNHKWMRNLVISQMLVEHFESLKMKYPEPKVDADTLRAHYFDKKGKLKPEFDVPPAPEAITQKHHGKKHSLPESRLS